MDHLFRKEVFEARSSRSQRLGQPAGPIPVSWWLVFALIASFIAASAAFLLTASISRKEVATGSLRHSEGETRIIAESDGYIETCPVSNGDTVHQGDLLATIATDRFLEDGPAVSETEVLAASEKIENLEHQQEQSRQLLVLQRRTLQEELTRSQGIISELEDQVARNTSTLHVAREREMRAIKALEEGLTTEPERHSRRLQVEALVQALADLKSRIAQAQSDIKIGRQRLEELEVEHRLSMSRLEQEIADSELVIARSQSARAYSLRAPQSGRVVGNLCRPGERVASQQPLLSIAPTASQLVGEFEIPPKAIALINTGQHVRIKYKSLPYQKFGIFTGTVTEVSAEFPAADEAPGRQAAAGTYRAVVSLDRQEIGIADKTIPLQSGMAFQAEIVLEKRVALAWLLDPLR